MESLHANYRSLLCVLSGTRRINISTLFFLPIAGHHVFRLMPVYEYQEVGQKPAQSARTKNKIITYHRRLIFE